MTDMNTKIQEWIKIAAQKDAFFSAYSLAYSKMLKKVKYLAKKPDTFVKEITAYINKEIKREDKLIPEAYMYAYRAALSKIFFDFVEHFFGNEGDASDKV